MPRKAAIIGADIFPDRREQELFRSASFETTYYPAQDPLQLLHELHDSEALIVNLERVTAPLLDALPNLKVIGRYGVGVDNIDLQSAADHRVAVIHVPDYCIDEVAEHAVSLILSANRKLFPSVRLTKKGIWGKVAGLKPIRPIREQTLGIVGTGRIGLKVAAMMQSFGCRMLVYDPYIKPELLPQGAQLTSFEHLLAESDLITIHCPLTEETRHLFRTETFRFVKQQPALINVSRGAIIRERDLIDALDQGIVSFAMLDVLESEPPGPNHPLLNHLNCAVTNHVAWYSDQAEQRLRDLLVTRVIDYLNGNAVPSWINRF